MISSLAKGLGYCSLAFALSACLDDTSVTEEELSQKELQPASVQDSVIALNNIQNPACPNGGVEVQMGIDANANGRLDPLEIDHSRTATVCHGLDGADGQEGISGTDGQNGSNGINSLIRIADADLSSCPYGGKAVSIGLDNNKNNILDDVEISQTESICNENVPTYTALINTNNEVAGPNCTNGGIKIDTGLDSNQNSVLDLGEIQNTEFVCHGEDGAGSSNPDLSNLLIETVDEPWGANCFHGGEKHQIGKDLNVDGALESAEIISASYSCQENEAPVIYFNDVPPESPQSDNPAIAGQSYSLIVKAYDNDDVFLSITNKPDWLVVTQTNSDHFELSGSVPNAVDVSYQVEVSATDTDASSTSIYEFTAKDGILVSAIAPATPVSEGDSGSKIVNFELKLSEAASNSIQVNYSLNSFVGLGWLENVTRESGLAVFEPGDTSKIIPVEVQGDTFVEIAESIQFSISGVENPGSEFIKISKPAYLDIANDDGSEFVFHSGQQNSLDVAYSNLHSPNFLGFQDWINIELVAGAPAWLGLTRDYHYSSYIPYGSEISFEKYVLSGFPESGSIGESGAFSLQFKSDRGQTTHDLTYRIVEGDSDNDGVLNSADLFPNNPRGQTDSDADGLGDEWEMTIFESLDTANATSDFDGNGVLDLSAFENNTSVNDLTFSFESGQLPDGWVNTGNVDWVVSDESSYHGGYALKPATLLEPGQVARLEMTLENNEGNLVVHGRAAEGEEYLSSYSLKFNHVDQSYNQIYLNDTGWNSASSHVKAGQNQFILEYRNASSTEVARQVYVDYFHGLSGVVPGDRDGDGVLNGDDAFPDNATASTDTDGDGIGDEWELKYFSDLYRANASSDDDSDGLSDLQEFLLGASPYNRDTDGDGVYDGQDLWVTDSNYALDFDGDSLADEWELIHFASLSATDGTGDADGDLISDADEFSQGTTPAPDTDGDGYSDLQDAFVNDPAYALDEDSDGLPDEWESNYGSLYNLYPEGDRDNDGLSDKQEFLNGTNPIVVNLNAVQDVFAVSAGQNITFNPVDNDISAQESISVSNIQLPQAGQGTLQDNGDGTYTFSAPLNFIGWIQLNYTAVDTSATDTSEVMIRVSDQQFGQVVKIKGAEGGSHTMALFDDGTLYAWGNNSSGQLGVGDSEARYSPVLVSGLDNVKDFDLGGPFSLALKDDGTVWWWGNNSFTPFQLHNVSNIQAIAASNSNMYVLNADGTVAFANYYNGVSAIFNAIPSMVNIQDIAAGNNHVLALDNNGVVLAEGHNGYGQLGNGSTAGSYNQGVEVSKISNIQSIEAGGYQSFAINDQGQLFAWGNNSYGQLGDGGSNNRDAPLLISAISNVAEVSSGNSHTLLKTQNGELYGMGSGSNGVLGPNALSYRNESPILLFDETVEVIGTGSSASYVLTESGDTLSVGYNYNGRLGDGTVISREKFVKIDWLHVGYEGILSQLTGEGFEWGVLPSFWRNTGDSWEISTESNTGNYSLKVKDSVSDNSNSSVGLQITTGAGDVSFLIKTSTEADYDELIFYIDGVEQARYSGEADWSTTFGFTVEAGTHIFEWTYVKDSGTSFGEDTVWLDDIVLPIDTDGDGTLDFDDLDPNNPLIM